jgi:hypothetical protein
MKLPPKATWLGPPNPFFLEQLGEYPKFSSLPWGNLVGVAHLIPFSLRKEVSYSLWVISLKKLLNNFFFFILFYPWKKREFGKRIEP